MGALDLTVINTLARIIGASRRTRVCTLRDALICHCPTAHRRNLHALLWLESATLSIEAMGRSLISRVGISVNYNLCAVGSSTAAAVANSCSISIAAIC